MSEMNLDIVCRARLDGYYTYDHALEFCNQFLKPISEDELDYDPEDNDGFSFSLFGGRLYLDYYIKYKEKDCYDIDFDFDENLADEISTKLGSKFGEYGPINDLIGEVKYKVLYYYNGGCAGACEVE